MALEKELETFSQRRASLMSEAGKYVVICGEELLGVYTAYEDALKVGYERFGLAPFLVKRIAAIETVQHFTRQLHSCQS